MSLIGLRFWLCVQLFKCFPPIKHAFSHNVRLMKSYLDPFWQASAFVVSNLITFLIIIYNITKDSQQWLDVFFSIHAISLYCLYAAANSTSIIVSLFLMCRNFFFLNLINHIRTLHQSLDRYTRHAFELLFGDNNFFSVW